MDFTVIQEYFILVVVVGCLVLGYLLKNFIDDVKNRYIPTILAIVGAVLTCLVNGGITVENVVYGAAAGLASTGLHQAFKSFVEKKQ